MNQNKTRWEERFDKEFINPNLGYWDNGNFIQSPTSKHERIKSFIRSLLTEIAGEIEGEKRSQPTTAEVVRWNDGLSRACEIIKSKI